MVLAVDDLSDGKTTFDRVARFYPLLEQAVFGSKLSQARRFFIPRIVDGRNILLLGEGNGRFLLEAMKVNRLASFTVVDSSAQMLASAARRIANLDYGLAVALIHADIFNWRSPVEYYDRIVTNFFLDVFLPPHLRQLVEIISSLSTEKTLWINVDFGPECRSLRQKILMWAQYRFFRILTGIEAPRLIDPLPFIQEAGWEILEERSLESGWITARLLSAPKTQARTR
jgi:ubiquinone/menaquinone biosynthesis C-methylase UbiE